MVTASAPEIQIEERHRLPATVVFHRGRNLRLMALSRLVLELSALFALRGARRITSPLTEREAYLLLDWEEMERAFKEFAGSAIKGRAEVSVEGTWMPVKTGGKHRGKGCACISISLKGARMIPRHGFFTNTAKGTSRELALLREAIESDHGSIRIMMDEDATSLNIYLPVLERG